MCQIYIYYQLKLSPLYQDKEKIDVPHTSTNLVESDVMDVQSDISMDANSSNVARTKSFNVIIQQRGSFSRKSGEQDFQYFELPSSIIILTKTSLEIY